MGVIVVGLDSSDTSRQAFHHAIKEAQWRDGSLLAVHAVSVPVSTGYDYPGLHDDVIALGQEVLVKEIETLEVTYPDGFPVDVETRLVTGHPGAQLIATATDIDGEAAELVVLGSRGFGGFKGLLLGSVSTYAVHHLSCPLLIVPSIDADS